MPRFAVSNRAARWIVAPALLLLMALVGMAIGSESRNEYGTRAEDPATADQLQGRGNPRPQPAGGGQSSPDAGGESPAGPSNSPNDGTDPGVEIGSSTDGPDVSFEIRGDAGGVGIRLDPNGANVAFPHDSDGASGLPSELTTVGLPPGSGFRLTADGRLEAIPLEQNEAGDIVLQPVNGRGVDILRPDGSRVEARTSQAPDGGPDTVELTEVTEDGERGGIEADRNGSVEVGDGISIQLPSNSGDIPPQAEPGQFHWRLFVAWILTMIVGSLGLAYYLHRIGPKALYNDTFRVPPEVAVARFVDFLMVLRMDPDPARAIRLAFEGAERGLGSLPNRLSTETPFEWHSRVTAEHPHLDDVLGSLCSRFATARFGPEPPTTADRNSTVDDLHRLAYLAGYHEVVEDATMELVGAQP